MEQSADRRGNQTNFFKLKPYVDVKFESWTEEFSEKYHVHGFLAEMALTQFRFGPVIHLVGE